MTVEVNKKTIAVVHNGIIENYIELRKILDNKKIFLSKKAIFSFGGYAQAQLRRLENKSARELTQTDQEKFILNSVNVAIENFKTKYAPLLGDALNLYIDKALNQEEFDSEIFIDATLKHYPLRDYVDMWSEMKSIVRSYSKLGSRNTAAAAHNKISKHMMHLVRLYLMCFDILEKKEIITKRVKDHDLLMSIRNGKYTTSDNQVLPEFYDMLDEFDKRFEYDKNNTDLPKNPDYKKITDLLYSLNNSDSEPLKFI